MYMCVCVSTTTVYTAEALNSSFAECEEKEKRGGSREGGRKGGSEGGRWKDEGMERVEKERRTS